MPDASKAGQIGVVAKRFADAKDFRKWLAAAPNGAVVEYHRGPGCVDLDRQVQRALLEAAGVVPPPRSAAEQHRQHTARGEYGAGRPEAMARIALFQKRLAPAGAGFSYRLMVLPSTVARALADYGNRLQSAPA